jgi:hypothetical protein
MSNARDQFIRDFSKEIEAGTAAVFVGAGLSTPAGYVDWKSLLRPVATDLGLNIDSETDLVTLTQFYLNEQAGNRARLNQLLIENFATAAKPTRNHELLARLPISTLWTTNYDKLIERAVEGARKVADVKYTVAHLNTTRPSRDVVVYKMHGDIDHPSEAVLSRDDFERYHIDRAPFLTALAGDLVSKTFVFLGFSFTDPNIDYILSRVRLAHGVNQRQHYCFMRAPKRASCNSDGEFDIAKIRQTLFINDLKRFGVKTIIVDEYDDMTAMLEILDRKHKQRSVFVSGSAHEYGTWTRDDADQLMRTVAASLVKRDFRLVSGFGLGIGSAVITGALQHIYFEKGGRAEDSLILRPFPQRSAPADNIAPLWTAYRRDMIGHAGIAVFAFGNREAHGSVENASGVREEFEIAVEYGVKPIPIGSTGFMAAELWKLVAADYDKYFAGYSPEFRAAFENLNASHDIGKLVGAVEAMTVEILARSN